MTLTVSWSDGFMVIVLFLEAAQEEQVESVRAA